MFVNLDLLAVTGWLIVAMPKGFFPLNEDTGLSFGFLEASSDVSFMGMVDRLSDHALIPARNHRRPALTHSQLAEWISPPAYVSVDGEAKVAPFEFGGIGPSR